jgi:hypothetical protein
VEVVTLLAVPFQPLNVNERTAESLLNGMLSVPAIFTTPGTIEERRILIASVLSDPLNRVWLVWQAGSLIGALLLTHISPKVDAQCHLVFFDRVLFGRKALLWNLMGKVFQELDLQRLTIEVPEYLTPLYKFIRKKLMFRLEGEGAAEQHPLITQKLNPYVPNGPTWVARLGSRRERAYWNPETKTWIDLLRLRLLRSEYEQIAGEAHAPRPTESRDPVRPSGNASAANPTPPIPVGVRGTAGECRG